MSGRQDWWKWGLGVIVFVLLAFFSVWESGGFEPSMQVQEVSEARVDTTWPTLDGRLLEMKKSPEEEMARLDSLRDEGEISEGEYILKVESLERNRRSW